MDIIDQAFKATPRENFVPDDMRGHAHVDSALPIGHGQTISQPTTVEMMLRWLDAELGNKILDIGSGSGWSSALLARIVGPKGKIYAVEKVPELVEFGQGNVRRLGIDNIEFYKAGKALGLSEYAPYDRILVSAAAEEFPEKLLEQLKPGGKLVIPVRNDILEIEKTDDKKYETDTHPGFVFVPLISDT